MKRARQFARIYLMFLALSVLGGCGDALTFYYEIREVSASQLEYLGNYYYGPSDKTTFEPDSYGINIRLRGEVLVADNTTSNPFATSAYAFTVEDDNYILLDKIANISIYTVNDFDAAHPAGSAVTDYFKTLDAGFFIPINDKVNGVNGLNADKYLESMLVQDYAVFLKQSPESPSQQQFRVAITFVSGRTISSLTPMALIQ